MTLAEGVAWPEPGDDAVSRPVFSVVMGEPSAKSLDVFKKVVIQTAERDFANKEIGRLELMRIKMAARNPARLKQMHQECAEQVLIEGKATSYGAIDWEKLSVFIKEILPIILEFIKFFSWMPDPNFSPFMAFTLDPCFSARC
jgi:hypothetical protein